MAAEQNITQTVTQAATEVAKAAIMTVREVENPVNAVISVKVMPRTVGPVLKQLTSDWKHQTPRAKMPVMHSFLVSSVLGLVVLAATG